MSNDSRYQYAADLSRPLAPSSSTSTLIQTSSSSSSSSNMAYSSSLAMQAPTPATTLSSAPTSDAASLSQPSLLSASASSSHPSSIYSSATVPSSRAFDSALAGYSASSTLADVSASCPPEGPSFSTTDFDADLAAAAFAPLFNSDTTSLETSSAPLSFPALPASLLDDAPEYEYVSGCPDCICLTSLPSKCGRRLTWLRPSPLFSVLCLILQVGTHASQRL